jgi:hypothetical protein
LTKFVNRGRYVLLGGLRFQPAMKIRQPDFRRHFALTSDVHGAGGVIADQQCCQAWRVAMGCNEDFDPLSRCGQAGGCDSPAID